MCTQDATYTLALKELRDVIGILEGDMRTINKYWYFLGQYHILKEDLTCRHSIAEIAAIKAKALLFTDVNRY